MMRRLFAALIGLSLGMATLPAFAIDLADAKAQGLVGEKRDGTVGAVGSANAELQAMIDLINAERRARYAEIAGKTGAPPAAVGAAAAQKIIGLTPAGQYVEGPDGSWMRK